MEKEIVIKIPEELYTEYVNIQLGRDNGKSIVYNLLKAIKEGTPLPKGHGRLIDADAMQNNGGKDKRKEFRKSTRLC